MSSQPSTVVWLLFNILLLKQHPKGQRKGLMQYLRDSVRSSTAFLVVASKQAMVFVLLTTHSRSCCDQYTIIDAQAGGHIIAATAHLPAACCMVFAPPFGYM